MESSERILVIFLSGALAVFLVLGILALVKIIQILNHVKRVSEKAELLASKAEAVGEFLERAATPLAAARMLGNVTDALFKRKRGTRRKS